MNYCEHHLGDYAKRTGGFSMLEHGAYAKLRDRYFVTEAPIPSADVYRQAGARSREEKAAVDVVLAEFYRLDGTDWRCDGFDDAIARAQAKIKAAKENGKRGGRPKQTEGEPNRNPVGSESVSKPKALQTPDTNTPPIPPKGAKSSAVGLKSWLEGIKAKGEKPVPEDDPVFAYAEQVGLPYDFLRLAWLEFRHRYSQPDAKRYRDWRNVFRKSVRGNWMKLWWLDPASESYSLTTTGAQAHRAHQQKEAA